MKPPKPPGTILRERFLKPLKISRTQLAEHLNWSLKQVNRICDNEAKITPEKATQLGGLFQIPPEFWLRLQNIYDLWGMRKQFKQIKPVVTHKEGMEIIKTIKLPKIAFNRTLKYDFHSLKIGDIWKFPSSPEKLRSMQSSVHQSARKYNRRYNQNIQIATRIKDNTLIIWRIQ
jgi:addiction module HigA family antidote